MSKYFVKVFTDEFNKIEWEDLKPEEIHFIKFKGKLFDEVRHGQWINYTEPDEARNRICNCSLCGAGDEQAVNTVVPYCWNCGAKMDGVE